MSDQYIIGPTMIAKIVMISGITEETMQMYLYEGARHRLPDRADWQP